MMDRPPPDLSTREGRVAHRAELGGLVRGPHYAGLVLLALGAVLIGLCGGKRTLESVSGMIGLIALLLGAMLVVTAIALRMAYHRRRMHPGA